jgi:RHS repeat-associated protein
MMRLKYLCSVFALGIVVKLAQAQQVIPGTTLVSAPHPTNLQENSETELLWAFEDFLLDTLASNTNSLISVGDVVAIFESFASLTDAAGLDFCPIGDQGLHILNRVLEDSSTYDSNGNKRFTDPNDIEAIVDDAGQIDNCDQNPVIRNYYDGTPFRPWWEWYEENGYECYALDSFGLAVVCVPKGVNPGDGSNPDDEDMWGGPRGGDPGDDDDGDGDDGDDDGPGGGGGPGPSDSRTLSGSAPLRSDLQSELYTRGANAKTISSTLAARGWNYAKGVDLRVSLPGKDYKLLRKYSNGPMMQAYSETVPWHLGRGWQTNAQSWVAYRTPEDRGFSIDDQVPLIEQIDSIQVQNFPVSGSTRFYPDTDNGEFLNMYRSGGGGSTTLRVETIDYREPQSGREYEIQAFVQRKAGSGVRVYYFHNEHAILNEPEAPLNENLDGYLLYEEDSYGNRWSYSYFYAENVNPAAPPNTLTPFLDAIYLDGLNAVDSTAWVQFVWNLGDNASTSAGGQLDAVEVHRKVSGVEVITDRVIYRGLHDLAVPGWHLVDAATPTTDGLSLSNDNLVQVEIYNGIDLPIDGDSVSHTYTPEYLPKVLQYRYTGYHLISNEDGSSASQAEVLSYEFGPDVFEWLAENATSSSVTDVLSAAELMLSTDVNQQISIVGGDTVKPIDLADSIVEYYDAYPMLGQVHRRWTRSGSGKGMTTLLEYDYARAYVDNWDPYPAGNTFEAFDVILKPRRYSTRIKEYTRPGTRQSSLSINQNTDEFMGEGAWEHNKTTYHWSEDVVMHEFASMTYYGEQGLPFLRRFRTPVTVATAIVEPGWEPGSTSERAWFTFTKYKSEFSPSSSQGFWMRENGQELQLLHPSALQAPFLEQVADGVYWTDGGSGRPYQDMPYLLDYGTNDYVIGSAGFMAAKISSQGGKSDRWEYDSLNRLTGSFSERAVNIDQDGDVITDSVSRHLIESLEYEVTVGQVSAAADGELGLRTDLVSEISTYRDPNGTTGSDDVSIVQYDYTFESMSDIPNKDDRVTGTKQTVERELESENGPGGLLVSYKSYDTHGDLRWSFSTDEVLTTYSRDSKTGKITKKQVGVSSVPNGQNHSGWTISPESVPSSLFVSENVVDCSGNIKLSVSPSGTVSRIGYFYGEVFGVSSDSNYLGQVSVPHLWTDSSNDKRISGPVYVDWFTADGRAIAQYAYVKSLLKTLPIQSQNDTLDMNALVNDLRNESGFEIVSKSEQHYDINGFGVNYKEWNDVDDQNAFYEYQYEYDALGRSTKTIFPDGTIEQIAEYDIRDRSLKIDQGTQYGSLATVLENHYDSSSPTSQGVGNGLLTWSVVFPGDGTQRYTRFVYDWRDRHVLSTPPMSSPADYLSLGVGPIQAVLYDNQGRVVESSTLNQGSIALVNDLVNGNATSLAGYAGLDNLARTFTKYSQRGIVYRTGLAIEPSNSSTEWLVSNVWFDDAGRSLAIATPAASVQKYEYDTQGRPVRTLVTDGKGIKNAATDIDDHPSGVEFNDATDLTDSSEVILQQTSYIYFDKDAVVGSRHQLGMTEILQRVHTSTGPGGLGSNPIATYSGAVYDEAGRSIAAVNYGTNIANSGNFTTGGSAPSLLTTTPARTPSVIVSETFFDERGLVSSIIDPLGRESRFIYDSLGRKNATIQNAAGTLDLDWNSINEEWVVSNRSTTDSDKNRVVTMVYDSWGNTVKQAAHKVDGGADTSQTTRFVYELPSSPLSGNASNVHGLLYEIHYPDPLTGQPSTSSSDHVRFAYNRLGEQVKVEDQNATIRSFEYDEQGRITHELVDTSNSVTPLDESVLQFKTSYDEFGRVSSVESLDNGTSGSGAVVNSVSYTYDSMTHDLISLDQTHGGATKTIEWSYSNLGYTEAEGNRKRLEYIKYPDGTQYAPDFGLADSVNSRISRVGGYIVTENGAGSGVDLISYKHLGVGTVAVSDHLLGGFQLDRTVDGIGQRNYGSVTSGADGEYPGWDRFGRLQSQSWVRSGAASTGTGPDRIEFFKEDYTWDSSSNLLTKVDKRWYSDQTDRDWDIRYDGLNRVVEARRGVIDVDGDIDDPDRVDGSQEWGLDELGNWDTTDVQGVSSQTRVFNENNELESIVDSSTGTDRTLTYDENGNLIKIEHDTDSSQQGFERTVVYEYDAWNRLVRVREDGAVYVEFEYNPLHWRVAKRVNADYVTDTEATNGFEEVRRRVYSPSWQLLEEEIETDGLHAGAERRDTYFWGKRSTDEILSKRKVDLTGPTTQWWHYVTDHLFSVRGVIGGGVTGTAGILHERVEYDAYGRPKVSLEGDANGDGAFNFLDTSLFLGWNSASDARADLNGDLGHNFLDISAHLDLYGSQAYGRSLTNANTLDGPDNSIGYGGYHWDEELGMWLSRHRVYDPELGRWVQRDPAGYVDGMSLYAYVQGNPFSFVDPMGLATWFGNAIREAASAIVSTDTLVGDIVGGALALQGDRVDSVLENPGGALYNGTVGRVENAYNSAVATIDRIDQVTQNADGPDAGLLDYAMNGAAVLTGAQNLAEGIAGVDVASNSELSTTDRWSKGLIGGGQMALITTAPTTMTRNGGGAVQQPAATSMGMHNHLVRSAVLRGKEKHKEFAEKVSQKPGWQSERSIRGPNGELLRPDAIDPKGRPVELKPNTESGRKKGEKQIEKYKEATGTNGRVVYYD